MKYLFSPLGMTDPIKYQRDGSMLHIARVYRPDIIYLYMSKQILEFHQKDNRYVETLHLLEEKLQHHFEIRIIGREYMVAAHSYDEFYDEFHSEISRIEHEMMPGDELLLNMSSGTPAMKNALLTLSVLAEFRFLPVQVTSPMDGANLEHENRKDYDIQLNWEMNLDNEEKNFINRTVRVDNCRNLVTMLKKDLIKKHLKAYNYAAARQVGEEIRSDLHDETFMMLCMAEERSNLNLVQVDHYIRQYQWKTDTAPQKINRELYEYALTVQIKLLRKEYADFIRSLTPMFPDLLECLLLNVCSLDMTLYYNAHNRNHGWNKDALCESDVLKILCQAYGENFRFGRVYSAHLIYIFEKNCSDIDLKTMVRQLRSVEVSVRNAATHEIISVTDDRIKAMSGLSSREIMYIIRKLFAAAQICNDDGWNSYDQMNEMIIQKLEE